MTKWDEREDQHRDFLLAALRGASARAKLMDADLISIGIALKHKLVTPDMAVKWVSDAGLMFLVEPLPGDVGQIAIMEGAGNEQRKRA